MQIFDKLKPPINFKQAFITVLTNIVFLVTWQPRRAPTNQIPKNFNCLAISFRYFSYKLPTHEQSFRHYFQNIQSLM